MPPFYSFIYLGLTFVTSGHMSSHPTVLSRPQRTTRDQWRSAPGSSSPHAANCAVSAFGRGLARRSRECLGSALLPLKGGPNSCAVDIRLARNGEYHGEYHEYHHTVGIAGCQTWRQTIFAHSYGVQMDSNTKLLVGSPFASSWCSQTGIETATAHMIQGWFHIAFCDLKPIKSFLSAMGTQDFGTSEESLENC